MTARFALLALIVSLPAFATIQAQDATHPIPVGWAEMDEATKAQFVALWEDFQASRAAMKLSDEEKDALSEAERRAFYQTFWQVQAGFREQLAAAGFELESAFQEELAATVKATTEKSAKSAPASKAGPSAKVAASKTGTIQYDDGMITTSFGSGSIIGNRFNTFSGGNPVGSNGTINTVEAVVVQGGAFTTQSAGFVVEGPQTVGGGAMAIFSTFTNAGTGATETVTFPGLGVNYAGSSFFVLFGDFNNSYIPAFGTGTVNGQGHHGAFGDTGGMGPNVTNIIDSPSLNALIRVTGNIVYDIPVELMKFEVESEKAAE